MPGRVAAVVEQSWHRVPGGTATATMRTLAAVARRDDWQVVGLAAAHRSPPAELAPPPVEVCHLRLPRPALYWAWHRLRRPALPPRVGPVDIVHATGGVVPPPGRAPLVVTIHDLAFFHRPEHFTTRGVRFMSRAFELARDDAARIVVPSEATAADCRTHGVDDERLHVVPWGVTGHTVDDEARNRVRRRHGLPPEFALWVGTTEPRKNLARLIAATARTETEMPLILVGPNGWGIDLDHLIARSPRPVRHIGVVPGDDLAVLYDLAEVFVYPSLMEGFGMPVLEAMAQGTPVVTSAGTSTEEAAGGAGRLVDPLDVDSIAAGIDAVVADPQLRHRLGEAGRSRARTMTWERTAEGTVAAYEAARS